MNRRAQGLGVVKRGLGPQATCHVLLPQQPLLSEPRRATRLGFSRCQAGSNPFPTSQSGFIASRRCAHH